jgi:hypothetical protein
MDLIVMVGPEDSESSGEKPLVKSVNSPAFAPLSNEAIEDERQSVFTSLVGDDSDVVGLVAYSIYKQNKHDFLVAFNRQLAREPNEAELSAYIMGEATPRRLAIYRHLAQSTLAGKSPDVQTAPGLRASANSGLSAVLKSPGGLLLLANLGLVSVLFVWLLVRFGLTG